MTKFIEDLLASETPAVQNIRAAYHHMNTAQRAKFTVDINTPTPDSFSEDMTLARFIAKISKKGYDIYTNNDVLPPLEAYDFNNLHVFDSPIDNKLFVDKFAAPNATFAKYTDPDQYIISRGKTNTFLIDTTTAVTEVKSFCEVVACRILKMLNDPSYFYTLSYVLHTLCQKMLVTDGKMYSKPSQTSSTKYINGTGTYSGVHVSLDKPYQIVDPKKTDGDAKKKSLSVTASEIINDYFDGDAKKKVFMKVEHVNHMDVRFPDGFLGNVYAVSKEIDDLVKTVLSLCGIDHLYAGAIANKETGMIKFGGGITTRGCHYHDFERNCPYSEYHAKYDEKTPCVCGNSKMAFPHYDPESTGAGFAECDCRFIPTIIVKTFCSTTVRECRYLPKTDSVPGVPERLIGKAYGAFRKLSAEDKTHIVPYDLNARLFSGSGFVKKISQLTHLFKDLTPSEIEKLHRKTDGDRKLAISDDRIAIATVASTPLGANWDIEYRPCVVKSTFGYSIKYEINTIYLNGIPISAGKAEPDDGFSFEDDFEVAQPTLSQPKSYTPARTHQDADEVIIDTDAADEILREMSA